MKTCPFAPQWSPLIQQGARLTGMEIAAIAGAAASIGSMGMGIIGASQQSDAQRQAGEVAYRNALVRQQYAEAEARRLENEARQRDDQANAEQAAAQRKGLEEKRRAKIAAGRAQTVMAAGGAGVDYNAVSDLLAEGDLALDTALYDGDTRAQGTRYQGSLNRYEAGLKRWQGRTEASAGAATRAAMNTRADNTLFQGVGNALFKGVSLAGKYADGPAPTPAGASPVDEAGYAGVDWNRYDLNGQLT